MGKVFFLQSQYHCLITLPTAELGEVFLGGILLLNATSLDPLQVSLLHILPMYLSCKVHKGKFYQQTLNNKVGVGEWINKIDLVIQNL